mmetsp:Transcript_83980/g.271417  ORF Transcript_83980/g.271417 Transcript_83980/m.271417 type:complete len:100 (-) Transcript_83980:1526-1825(-)
MDALRTLHRKPDVLKVIVAAGIVSAGMTGTGLVVPVIANQFWGVRMAEIGSMMGIARSVVQILFTPAFGERPGALQVGLLAHGHLELAPDVAVSHPRRQ